MMPIDQVGAELEEPVPDSLLPEGERLNVTRATDDVKVPDPRRGAPAEPDEEEEEPK